MPLRLWRLPLALLVITAVLLLARSLVSAGGGLTARYYANPNLKAPAALLVVDPVSSADQMERRWGNRIPDEFSVSWTGYLTVLSPGAFEFSTTAVGRSQLFVDGMLVADSAVPPSEQHPAEPVRLDRGPHAFRLTFVRQLADFELDWGWARAGGPMAPVPTWRLSPAPMHESVVLIARVIDLAVPWGLLAAGITGMWSLTQWLHARSRSRSDAAPIAPALLRTVDRLLVVVAAVLPVFLMGHAMTFWGRGTIDSETTSFVLNYLADRPFLETIFDPRLNDWGSFQARELSYVLDRLDARVFAALLDRHTLMFVPLSGILGLLAVSAIYMAGARRVLRLDVVTSALLLSVFLSCIVTQASTPVLYRSAKILLSVAQLAFLFQVTRVLMAPRRRISAYAGLFGLGVLMSMSDRQGYFYLVATTATLSVLWVKQRVIGSAGRHEERGYGPAAIAGAIASAWAVSYDHVIAPRIILWTNGYWPDLSYQDVPLDRFGTALIDSTLQMFREQVSYFFGNLPFLLVCLVGLGMWMRVRASRAPHDRARWRDLLTSDSVLIGSAIGAGLLTLIAVMGMRHPPVFRMPDHSFWYYTLSIQVMLLFSASLGLAQLREAHGPWSRRVVGVVLFLMAIGNMAHYGTQREIMIASPSFRWQYWAAREFGQDFEAREANTADGALPSWMRPTAGGAAEVHWPLPANGFLDNVRAAYATLVHRPPLADAGGPYWESLREFLAGPGSPLSESGQIAPAVQALQSVGVRRLVLHRNEGQPPGSVDAIVQAARTVGGRVSDSDEDDAVVSIDLPDTRRASGGVGARRRVPPAAYRLSASTGADLLPLAEDLDLATEWTSGGPQRGDEWIRLDFDRPHAIAVVRLELSEKEVGRYPRRLAIEANGPDGSRTLYEGSPLGAVVRGLLRQPARAPVQIDLPPYAATTLIIRQTGRSDVWSWPIRELAVLEAAE